MFLKVNNRTRELFLMPDLLKRKCFSDKKEIAFENAACDIKAEALHRKS